MKRFSGGCKNSIELRGPANYRRIWSCYLAFSKLFPESLGLSNLSFFHCWLQYEVNFLAIEFESKRQLGVHLHYG